MPRSLKPDEIERICSNVRETLKAGTLCQRRDAVAILLGLSGLRIGEVCQLNRNDLTRDEDGQHWIKVRTLKGGRRRAVPIEKNLAHQLRALRHRGSAAPLLQVEGGGRLNERNVRRSWHQLRVAARVAPARFHDLRHTAAMAAWEQSGHNLFVVSTLLGHRKIENTRVYLATAGAMKNAVIAFAVPAVRSALSPHEDDTTSRQDE